MSDFSYIFLKFQNPDEHFLLERKLVVTYAINLSVLLLKWFVNIRPYCISSSTLGNVPLYTVKNISRIFFHS